MNNNSILKVVYKNKWGIERIYPFNKTADLFCKLIGKETLTTRDIKCIEQLGYKIEIRQSKISL